MRQFSKRELALLAAFAVYNLAILTLLMLFLVKVYEAYSKGEQIILPLVGGFAIGAVFALVLLLASKRIVLTSR